MSIHRMLVALSIAALLVVGFGSPVSAQSLITDVALKPGQVYWVTKTDGSEVKGFITERTGSEVRVSSALGQVAIPVSDVFRISKPDGLKEGFFMGLGLGVVMIAVAPADDEVKLGGKVAIAAYWGLTLGGIGALIDKAVHGRTDVYRQPVSTSVSVAPIASGRRLGLRATVRW